MSVSEEREGHYRQNDLDREHGLKRQCVRALPGVLAYTDEQDPVEVLTAIMEAAFAYRPKDSPV